MSDSRPTARTRSRQVALQVLHAAEHAAGDDPEAAVARAFEDVADHFELPEGARAFAKELVTGVARHRAALDEQIAAVARNWRIDRMARVDRNALRIGAYEILYTGVPAEVAIDEAVELARRFGSERSPAFVNGVLDGIARRAGRAPEPPGETS